MNSCTFLSRNQIEDIASKFNTSLKEKFGNSVSYDPSKKEWFYTENSRKIPLIAVTKIKDLHNTSLQSHKIKITCANNKLNQAEITNLVESTGNIVGKLVIKTEIGEALSDINTISYPKLELFRPLVNLQCNSKLTALKLQPQPDMEKEISIKERASIFLAKTHSLKYSEITTITDGWVDNVDIKTIANCLINNDIQDTLEVIFNTKSYYISSEKLFESSNLKNKFTEKNASSLPVGDKDNNFTVSKTGRFLWSLTLNEHIPFQFLTPMLQAMEISSSLKSAPDTYSGFKNWTASYLILAYVAAHHYECADLKKELLKEIVKKNIVLEEEYGAIREVFPAFLEIVPADESKEENLNQENLIFSLLFKPILDLNITLDIEDSLYKEYGTKISSLSFIANDQSKQKLDIEKLKAIISFCPNAISLDIKGYTYNIYDIEKYIENNQFHTIKIDKIIFDENNSNDTQLRKLWIRSTNLPNGKFPFQLDDVIQFIRQEVITPFNLPPGVLSNTSSVIRLLEEGLVEFRNLPNELRNDFNVALTALQKNGKNLVFIGDDLRNGDRLKDLTIAAVTQNGMALEFVKEDFKNDSEIVKQAYRQNPWSLQFASRNVILEMVRDKGRNLKFAGKAAQMDIEIVKKAYEQRKSSLRYAGINAIHEVVEGDGKALEHAGLNARDNIKIVTAAFTSLRSSLAYASRRTILQMLNTENTEILQHTSDEIKNDIEVVRAAFKADKNSLQYANDRTKHIILYENKEALKFAGDKARSDFSFVLTSYLNDGNFKFADLPRDQETMKSVIPKNVDMVKNNGEELKNLNTFYRNNYYINSIAYEQKPEYLKFAKNKDFILEKLDENGENLKYVQSCYKEDINLVRTIYQKHPTALQHADLSVIREIMKEDGMALQFAGEKAQKDRIAVRNAIEQNPNSKSFAKIEDLSSTEDDQHEESLFSRLSQGWKMKWS